MASVERLDDSVELTGGVSIPWIGLGTYLAEGDAVYRAVLEALEVGYRHIDTASFYENEREIGRAVRASGLPRASIFVTTKLWNSDHRRAREAFLRSRDRLDLGAPDLYLVHWPVPDERLEAWAAMELLLAEGACRAIGVSNYMPWHLDELLAAGDVVPAVNQVEFSPFLYQRDLLEYCHERGVRLQAYSPLTKGERLDDPRLVAVAERLGRTPAQVLIRWCLERDVIVLPKSADPERIRENAAVVGWTIPPDALAALDGLHDDFRTSWDPTGEK